MELIMIKIFELPYTLSHSNHCFESANFDRNPDIPTIYFLILLCSLMKLCAVRFSLGFMSILLWMPQTALLPPIEN